jgi:hypothetical protein
MVKCLQVTKVVVEHGFAFIFSAGLLTLGWWCSGCTARARCLFRSFVGRHFLKEGVWSWFWIQVRTHFLLMLKNWGGGRRYMCRIERKQGEKKPVLV